VTYEVSHRLCYKVTLYIFFLLSVTEYKVADMGYLRYYLAPKMEDSDD